jgi:hypothetical protein
MAAVPSVIFGLWGVFFLQANVLPVLEIRRQLTSDGFPFAVTDSQGHPLSDASAFTSSAFYRRNRGWVDGGTHANFSDARGFLAGSGG